MVIFFPLLGVLIGLGAARAKGLGTAAGIIGGFLLGPLAVLMFLCSGSKKRCVYCSEWIEKPAMVCYYCGKDQLPKQESAQSSPPPASAPPQDAPVSWASQDHHMRAALPQQTTDTNEKRVPCPFCGEAILPIAQKCRFCGSMLNEPIPQKKSAPQEVKVNCPFCQQKLSLDIADNGKEFCCPQCSNMFRFEVSED